LLVAVEVEALLQQALAEMAAVEMVVLVTVE
jgi:hypothetical protein